MTWHISSLLIFFTPTWPTYLLPAYVWLPFSCPASHSFIRLQQNNDNETPLHCAAQYGHSGVVRILLEELTDPTMRNNKFETPLDLAALYGRLEVVKLLLSAHPSLLSCNTKKHTPLHLASRNGHLPVVEVLLDAGMDINYEVCFNSLWVLQLWFATVSKYADMAHIKLTCYLNCSCSASSCYFLLKLLNWM